MSLLKQSVKHNFSKNARYYDRHSGIQAECARRLIKLIKGGKFRRILEIGCGTGIYTRLLCGECPDAEITAVDISEAMVNNARKKLKNKNLCFKVTDGEHLPVDRRFDLVTSNASFQWLEDPEAAFRRFSKSLLPNGAICFSMYGPGTFIEFEKVLGERLGKSKWLTSSGFVPAGILENVLGRYFDHIDLQEESFRVNFTSLWEFLRDIKLSGTRGNGLNGKAYLTRRLLSDLEKTYLDRFGGIVVTHHVYFCKAYK